MSRMSRCGVELSYWKTWQSLMTTEGTGFFPNVVPQHFKASHLYLVLLA
jgi:hypothetical protein